ncbi:hypothetical protein ACVWZ4_000704 [Bradyrhizobium sp. USDA 4472]
MSRSQHGPDRARRKRSDVGYGRPPPEHQFKPGQSGNKRGRPKGSKNEATVLDELFNRKVDVRQGGRLRKLSLLEAICLRCAEDALKGNLKATAFLLNRASNSAYHPSSQPATSSIWMIAKSWNLMSNSCTRNSTNEESRSDQP